MFYCYIATVFDYFDTRTEPVNFILNCNISNGNYVATI